MRKIATLGLLLALGLFALTGCTTVQKYSAAGGVVGAAIGGPWANNSGTISTAGGIAIGAASGGLLGALVGDAIEECKEKKEKAEFEAKIADLENQLKAKDEMIAKLQKEIDDLKARGVCEKIELSNDVLFASGKNVLTKAGKETLTKVINHIKSAYPGKTIVVEGYTDADPIKRTRKMWKSNWELGAGRALSVLHFMIKEGSMDPKMISAQTFGEFQPKADNTTKAGKAQNRRSVITVLAQPLERRTEEVK